MSVMYISLRLYKKIAKMRSRMKGVRRVLWLTRCHAVTVDSSGHLLRLTVHSSEKKNVIFEGTPVQNPSQNFKISDP